MSNNSSSDDEVRELKESVSALASRIDAIEMHLERVDDLEDERDDLAKRVNDLERENDALRQQVADEVTAGGDER